MGLWKSCLLENGMRTLIHPGEILKDELTEMGISGTELSRQISLPEKHILELLSGNRDITDSMATHLGKYFGNSATFWTNLQRNYNHRLKQDE